MNVVDDSADGQVDLGTIIKADQGQLGGLLAISALNSFAAYMAIPLITIHAVKTFGLTITETGLLAAVWPATVLCLSVVVGTISDRVGYAFIIRLFLLGSIWAFLVLAISDSVYLYAAGLFLYGCGKATIDGSLRAAMTCVCPANERAKYFRLRYLLINVGAAAGPLAGMFLYKHAGAFSFNASGALLLMALCISVLSLRPRKLIGDRSKKRMSLSQLIRPLADSRMVGWLLSAALVLATYSAFESFIPIISEEPQSKRPEAGYIFSLNAIIVIAVQIIHFKTLRSLSLRANYRAGFTLMVAGFLLFGISENSFSLTLIAVVVLSTGEAFMFPCYDVLIDQIAPAHEKGLYFGSGELRQVGSLLGPIIGGLTYMHLGSSILLLSSAIAIAASGMIFSLVAGRIQPKLY